MNFVQRNSLLFFLIYITIVEHGWKIRCGSRKNYSMSTYSKKKWLIILIISQIRYLKIGWFRQTDDESHWMFCNFSFNRRYHGKTFSTVYNIKNNSNEITPSWGIFFILITIDAEDLVFLIVLNCFNLENVTALFSNGNCHQNHF